MADEFPMVPLGEVATVRSGFAFKSSDMGEHGVPIIKIKNITPPFVDTNDCEKVPETLIANLPNSDRYLLEEGDILIAMTGATAGKVGRFPKTELPHYLNQRVGKVYLTNPDRAAYRYLYFVLSQSTFVQLMFGLADGSAQGNFSGSQIENLEIPLPPLNEQQAIACILGALDDKIELNGRMNDTLEGIAQTLFNNWFVDATRERLPDGWREASLDSVAHFLNGLALQKFPPDGEDSLPVIKIAQLRAGNTDGADRASAKIPTEYIVEDGDILFSWSGSLEVELWCAGRGALNQHLFKVTSQRFPKWFYFLWTRHHLRSFQAVAAGKATTMGHIQRHHLTEARVFVPTPAQLEKMDRQMSRLIEKMITNRLSSRALAALRDTLLSKLISGELRVPDAERIVARCA